MSSPKTVKKSAPPRSFGWMAEYSDEHALLEACRKVRDSGYTRTDAFTPFPVHGIDEALGIKPTVLPWIVLCMGLSGLSLAVLMQWWMNAVDYPYIISGKPYFSLPAFIPVTFEMTILFSAFTTFFSMIFLNGLPKFSNPVFTNPKFDRATDDRFFLWVDSRDKYFNSEKVKSLLDSTHPLEVEIVREDETESEVPSGLYRVIAALILFSFIPGAAVLRMRAARSEDPRWHVFFDMDFQPKKKALQSTTLFDDHRVMRQPVKGTVARGDLTSADPYYLGYTPDSVALVPAASAAQFVRLQDPAQPPAAETKTEEPKKAEEPAKTEEPKKEEPAKADAPAAEPAKAEPAKTDPPKADEPKAEPAKAEQAAPAAAAPAAPTDGAASAPAIKEPNWITEFPLPVDEKLMALGKLKFETNCAVCHGFSGSGDGLVSQRALQLAEGYWTIPTSMHDPRVQQQPVGKIYDTITNGRGKMGPYGSALTTKERWAVVLYVRALQRSRDAKASDVPESKKAKPAATN
ncbi:MAG: quinol:electron acceptor oxidoreductase subunit ActD [Pirellulales bacterium]